MLLRDFGENLRSGLRLALFLPAERDQFHPTSDQACLLILFNLAVTIAAMFFEAGYPAIFNRYGIAPVLAGYLFLFAGVYAVARLQGRPASAVALVVLLSAAVLPMVAGAGAVVLANAVPGASTVILTVLGGLSLLWIALVTLRAIRFVYGSGWLRSGFLAVLVLAISFVPSMALPALPLWTPIPDLAEVEGDDEDYGPEIDVEATYYIQPALLQGAADELRSQRPGIPDLFFVGFAGYPYEDVFLHEVQAARALFDQRYDTQGHSLLLANNPASLDEIPLANAPNLRRALDVIGNKMDPEEDILFLFLTSHGSPDWLSNSFWEFGGKDLGAADLRDMLDASKIKWRVIVVSACYSGSFIDELQSDNTLVLTSSQHDRTSFGCGHDGDFTYFGKALFGEQLRQEISFVTAFQGAAAEVDRREREEELTPSLPQMSRGPAIAAKLAELENYLRRSLEQPPSVE